jgi:uncharacterized protein (DUF362 family)
MAGYTVGIVRAAGGYPTVAPYDADERFPEYLGEIAAPGSNPVYRAVRDLLRQLGWDREHFGTPEWNPLGQFVRPGDRVFVKPNCLTHEYRASCGPGELYSVITHPSVVRAMADYVAIALQGRGSLTIGDNPAIDTDFEQLLQVTRLDTLPAVYRKHFALEARILDLRPLRTGALEDYGFSSRARQLPGDPLGHTVFNLGAASQLHGLNPLTFRGIFTRRSETIRHHHGQTHEYAISNSILDADVFVSIPKLKTHHKVGVTLNLKGLVGINAIKNYLVHWRIGFPLTGGDEFPPPSNLADYPILVLRHLLSDLLPEPWIRTLRGALGQSRLRLLFADIEGLSYKRHRGAWQGNDTCWRMVADLYNLFVADVLGRRKGRPLRTLSIVDGIIAGEGNGPYCPKARVDRVLVGGSDLLAVDLVATKLMGFDFSKVAYLARLAAQHGRHAEDIEVISDEFEQGHRLLVSGMDHLRFQPPDGWPSLALKGGS